MQINGINSTVTAASRSSSAVAVVEKSSTQAVSISAEGKQKSESSSVYTMHTASGSREIDLAKHFEKQDSAGLLDFSDILLPNKDNVNALQSYISQVFPDFLARHGIAQAPETISYDNQGQMVLPADYPYAEQLKSALKQDSVMDRTLRNSYGLASQYSALASLAPMRQEADAAKNQAELNAVFDRYSHLLNDNAKYPEPTFSFSASGELSILS